MRLLVAVVVRVRNSSTWRPRLPAGSMPGSMPLRSNSGGFQLAVGISCVRGGCSLRSVSLVKAVRGAPQVARGVLGLEDKELSRMVRGVFDKSKFAKCTARRPARGSDAAPQSVDHWPGVKVTSRVYPGWRRRSQRPNPVALSPLCPVKFKSLRAARLVSVRNAPCGAVSCLNGPKRRCLVESGRLRRLRSLSTSWAFVPPNQMWLSST